MSLASRGIRVSLGHTSATYEQGLSALSAGASCLTHTLNCMPPLTHRGADPGLAALITLPDANANAPRPPYYGILADGVHLHPRVATLLFRASPRRALLVSDSIELAGLPDGLYPGHAQIPHVQRKVGDRATIEGSETLAGSCVTVGQCVKNMVAWSGCSVAEAARAATENVADFMGVTDRGKLEVGRRADFVVLDDEGDVKETWIAGEKVWEK
jgi:N-acetylglucosamine-6-phosphate deacetylase